ncbi:YitT family protein [Pueribacillus sp. YX66]|uniref:YczE/YyaS/YitT family protein n=1 Tax=Pueribacillus sp. YX66 TaxID=3229242 RepID=UPI00358D7D51
MNRYEQVIRWAAFFIGIAIMAFGIALTIKAELGIAPWDVLHIGLMLKFGLTVGSWSIIVGFFILTVSSLLVKRLPKLGAFLNMLFVGIFIDLFLYLPIIVTPAFFVGKLIMLIVGVIVCGMGMGIYISSDHGAGPRDSLMLALTELTKFKVQHVRLAMEVIVLCIGWLLGGPVFIGTVIVTVTIGPVVGYTLPFFRNMIKKMIVRGARNENFNKRAIRPHDYDGVSEKLR